MARKPVNRAPADQGLHVIAARFRLLGDVNRLKIINLLDDGANERSLADLRARTRISQKLLIKHLRALTSAGILAKRNSERGLCYVLQDESVNDLCDLVSNSVQRRLAEHVKICDDYEV